MVSGTDVEKYIAWRADSMHIRPQYSAIVLVLTMWAFAGLITLDVRLLCPHGGDLPRSVRFVPERASSPRPIRQCLYTRLRATSISPASPVVQVPTPPPKALSVSA